MAVPNPSNVAPWYLRNITQALELDTVSGQVFVRTNAAVGNITVGNISVSNVDIRTLGNVDISGNTLPVTVSSGNITVYQGNIPWVISNTNVAITSGNVGILGNVNVTQGTDPWVITGNANVTGNVTANVTGNVGVAGNVGILGNVNVTQGNTPWIISNTNVTITSGNVGVAGNVGIIGNVNVTQGTDPWIITGNANVTGNVNATVSGNVGILGNVNVTQGTDPWVITGNVTANIGSNSTVTLGGTNLDAFGRLRVSNPVTMFDSQTLYVDGGQFSNVTATGGAITYVSNESSFNLSVTAANGSSVINQAKVTQPYQPGKSLLTMASFCYATLATGCRQRVGYFTDTNGVYFEADGEDLYLVIRSRATGVVTEERVAQTNWNTDTLTGLSGVTNPSGIDLDPALVNIFWCDIEWLGVGTVRAGFIIDGVFIVCHKFNHANVAGNTKVYMTSASLNPRYEITNTAATAGARTMKQICCSVISEGGYAPTPAINYVSSGIQPTRIATGNTYTNLASIRLNPACPDAVVIPAQIDLLLKDVQYGSFQLVIGASNASGLTYANVNGGVVQANTSQVPITDGQVVYQGVTSSRDTFTVGDDVARRLQLQRYANGTPITMTLCAGYGANNADLIWAFGWQEVTNK